jgi:drug/metabolite transporter (DMT)-like permease
VVVVTVPLALLGRLRMTRRALPLVLASGVLEILGIVAYSIGARHGIAVAAVLSSQFAAMAAVAAYLVFRERLARVQVAGVAVIAVGVATLTALQA